MKRSVLITGASSGFGLLGAIELARCGFRVFATVRSRFRTGALLDAAIRAGVSVEVMELDLTRAASIEACASAVLAAAGGLDVLVNNAGIGFGGFFEDQSDAEVREQFEANVLGAMALTRAVLPAMRLAGRGRIVNVSSMGGRLGTPGLSVYSATKFALEGFSEALRHEVRSFGIEVALLEPGTYPTPAFYENRRTAAGALRPDSPYAAKRAAAEAALYGDLERRKADPAEVGRAIARLATVRAPPLRTTVGDDALLATWLLRLLPQRLLEWAVRLKFEPPARR